VTFGNNLTYDDSAYSFSSGTTVAVCRDDAASFDSVKLTDNAQLSSTVTIYIPAAAIRYIRLEITVPESLEYSDTVISGNYKAYYTYNTSRDVYTEEGIFIENFPATGDGSTEITETFTFTKYGLTATAEVVRKEGLQLVTQFSLTNWCRGVSFSSSVKVEQITTSIKYFIIRVTKQSDVALTIAAYTAFDDITLRTWETCYVPSLIESQFKDLNFEIYDTINITYEGSTYTSPVGGWMSGFQHKSGGDLSFNLMFYCESNK
jgi:hypothetical protein